nr:ribonuclease H-like domain-containing protein [Tanacetum cinerariifolium]
MYDEYNALVKNGTWLLVPRPTGVNMVCSMWLFKHKFHADGTLSHYKARLVANGSNQQLGVDFDETFSLVFKPATIRTVLSLAVSRKWQIHQLDIKNAFLNGDLSEIVYMHQAPGLVDARQGSQVFYLLLYVDDIILTASSTTLLKQLIDSLHRLFLSQQKYALQLLERAHMINCNPSRIPVDTKSKLGLDGVSVHDLAISTDLPLYARSARATFSLRYVQGTLDLGLHLYASFTTSLVGYTDADWAGCPSTCSAVYMSVNPVQHKRKKHIEIDIHFIRDMVTAGQVRILHVPYRYQYADIFTKGLPSALFKEFRSSLSVRPPFALTARAHEIRVIVHLRLLRCERMDFVTLWSGEEVTLEMRVNGIRKKYARNMSIEEHEA